MISEVQNKYLNIFEAIKCDDLVTFSALMQNEGDKIFSISFGRFPMLSVCYLYNAKKIITMYEDKLIKTGNFVRVYEPFEIYEKFVKLAKKSFRLYMQEDSTVYPIEMLVFTRQYDYLSNKYVLLYKNESILRNIEYISKHITKEKIYYDIKKFKVINPRLKTHQKAGLIVYASVSFIMAIMCVLVAIFNPIIIGAGTIERPTMIYSEQQLVTAMKKVGNYKLGKDIVLKNKWARLSKFAGTLDGGGHTIYTKGNVVDEFVYELTGTIKNVRFDFPKTEYEISTSKAFVVYGNTTGTIDNVDVSIECEFTTKVGISNEKSYIVTTICLDNYSVIKNCDAYVKYTYASSGVVDVYLSGLVGINRGNAKVENCTTIAGSTINATHVDVAGLVVFNYSTDNFFNVVFGEMAGLTNNCDIVVNSTAENWSPVVGGICIENTGIATNLKNTGTITVSESSDSEEDIQVSVAGLVVKNYYRLHDSCNTGNIAVSSKAADIRVGGIVVYVNYVTYTFAAKNSDIVGCYNTAEFSATTNDTKNKIVIGGIVAYVKSSNVINNYTVLEMEVGGSDSAYLGAICGLIDDRVTTDSNYGVIQNNEYLLGEAGVGGICTNEWDELDVYIENLDGDFATKHTSLENLKNSNIYWE